jgi:hypothetical protein
MGCIGSRMPTYLWDGTLDERQRFAWLCANRATLFVVGATWLGMIAWQLAQDRLPLFLIVMVPVFATVRLGFYLYYVRRR